MARSEVNQIYDAATAFRTPGESAMTASGTVGTFKLDKLVDVRPSSQRNKLGAESYKLVIAVESAATANGDETYTFDVTVGAEGAANTSVGSFTVGQPGQYIFELDSHTIENLDPDREEMELAVTTAGTSPSIAFAAWVV